MQWCDWSGLQGWACGDLAVLWCVWSGLKGWGCGDLAVLWGYCAVV